MKKIDTNKIIGNWQSADGMSGGDATLESIEMVAEKVNEIIDLLNKE